MTRISRNLSFFKRNYNSVFGLFWSLMAVFYLLSAEWDEGEENFSFIMAGGYFLIAAGYFYMAYQNRGNNGEYIEWDDEFIIYKPAQGKIHSYKSKKLIRLSVATNNLIIKAPNAQGTMAPLKGYSNEEIEKLRSSFGNFNSLKQA